MTNQIRNTQARNCGPAAFSFRHSMLRSFGFDYLSRHSSFGFRDLRSPLRRAVGSGDGGMEVGGAAFGRDRVFELAAPDEAFPDPAVALGALPGRMVLPGRLVAARMALHHRDRRAGKRGDEIMMVGEICGEHTRPLWIAAVDQTHCTTRFSSKPLRAGI